MHHDLLRLNGMTSVRSELRETQSTPNSPEMRRSAAAGRSVRLNTDFYQFNSTPKKICRGGESDEVEDMVCNGNADSPTEIWK